MPRYITDGPPLIPPVRHNRRPKVNHVTAFGTHTVTTWFGAVVSDQTSSSTVKFESSVTGDSDPLWREKVRKHTNATNSMVGEWVGCELKGSGNYTLFTKDTIPWAGKITVERVLGHYPPYILYQSPVHPGLASLEKSDTQALTRLYSAVRELQQQLSGPTFLGELRESVRMLRKPGEKMFMSAGSYLDAVKRGRASASKLKSGLASSTYLSHVISNAWLELSFGWKPLMADVEGIAVTVARMLNNIRHSTCRGFGEDKSLGSLTTNELPGPSQNVGINLRRRIEESVMTRYKCGVLASCDLPVGWFNRLRVLSGFQLSEFIPTAWELLPWSFLADYFGNIGNVLSAETTDTSAVVWVNKTVRRMTEWHNLVTLSNYAPPAYYLRESGSPLYGESTVYRKSVARSKGDKIPDLRLSFSLPGSKNQFANMVALLLSKARP